MQRRVMDSEKCPSATVRWGWGWGRAAAGEQKEEKVRPWFKCRDSSSAEVKVGTLCGPVAFLLSFFRKDRPESLCRCAALTRAPPADWVVGLSIRPRDSAQQSQDCTQNGGKTKGRWTPCDGCCLSSQKTLPSIFGRNRSIIKELALFFFPSSRLKWKYLWLNTSLLSVSRRNAVAHFPVPVWHKRSPGEKKANQKKSSLGDGFNLPLHGLSHH